MTGTLICTQRALLKVKVIYPCVYFLGSMALVTIVNEFWQSSTNVHGNQIFEPRYCNLTFTSSPPSMPTLIAPPCSVSSSSSLIMSPIELSTSPILKSAMKHSAVKNSGNKDFLYYCRKDSEAYECSISCEFPILSALCVESRPILSSNINDSLGTFYSVSLDSFCKTAIVPNRSPLDSFCKTAIGSASPVVLDDFSRNIDILDTMSHAGVSHTGVSHAGDNCLIDDEVFFMELD
jgi:hypothetical protein